MSEKPPPNPGAQGPIRIDFNTATGLPTFQVTCLLSVELTAKFALALESLIVGFNATFAPLPPPEASPLYSQVV